MKFAILALCVAVVAAKPHVYLFNGPAPLDSQGRVIETPEVAQARAAHLAAVASASASASSSFTSRYQGPPAPLSGDGRVIDTAEVAQLKAERLAALNKATAEAQASASAELQYQEVPTFIVQADHQGYSGPFAPIGQDGLVIDTEEVAKLKAEHLATFAEAQAKAAAFAMTSGSSSSAEGYSYEAPTQKFQPAAVYGAPAIPAQPQQIYNGPPAPLGQDGRVIDTDEVAKLKAEHIATLEKANAEAAASAESSSSSEGYHYEAPIQKIQAIPAPIYGAPIAEPEKTYNGPYATIGQDGHVVDTEEVAKLKAEHLATLAKANAEAAAIEAMEAAMGITSTEGYHYEAPAVKFQAVPAPTYGTPVAEPEMTYNGPYATIGQDGQVVDTEEVAKLKAEHLATLAKANAEAAAIEAMEAAMGKSSTEGYNYDAPAVKFEAVPAPTYGAPAAQPQLTYNGPSAPLGQDGQVIDTDEVASLKAERIATLEKAHAEAAASAETSSSSDGYHYEAPIQKAEAIPAPTYGVPIERIQAISAPTYGAPITQPEKIYNGPFATIGQDGQVVDTEEVAKLKAEHLATLAKANAEAAAIEAMEAAMGKTSNDGYHYEAPAVKFEAVPAPTYGAPAAQPQNTYNGPAAPLGQDGRVVDTDEVAMLKAEHIATLEKANAAAAASAAESSSSSEGYHYEAPIQKTEAIPAPTYGAPIAEPQKIYNGPFAMIGQDGRVVDTEEVAKLKAEHLATLAKANAEAAAIAAMEAALGKSSTDGYHYEAPAVRFEAVPAPTYGAPAAEPEKIYNGPFAMIGQDGRVVDTDEVARLKAEHIATLEMANAAAAAAAEAESSSSSEGYHYEAPIQKTEAIPAPTYGAPIALPHKIYNGPAAPLGQDGRVIDTDEVAKLKAEHIATLEKANAAAAASSAEAISTSAEGYTYETPIQKTEAIPAPTYGAPIALPQKIYNGPAAPLGQDGRVIDTDEVARLKAEHIATLEKANAAAAASSAEAISTSAEDYTFEAPIQKTEAIPAPTYGAPIAQPQKIYDGPAAPLGQDGRVIDTDEVARLKAEHIATLEMANAAAAAAEAASASSSSDQEYSSEAPVAQLYLPAPAVPAEIYGAPVTKIQQTYGGPLAPLSQDGQVIDTEEVAQLKAEHIATLAQANAKAEASAAASASSSSSASSSAEVIYGAPAVPQAEPIIMRYSGPFAPLAADGTVLDTDEVARLKAEHLAALNKATAEAIAHASAEDINDVYSPPLPAQKPYRGSFRGY